MGLRHRLRTTRTTRRPRTVLAGLALTTAAAVALPLLTAAPASAVSGSGMAIGAYATGGTSELNGIESSLGRTFDFDHAYIVFGDPNQSVTSYIGADRGKRTPYVNMSWNCGCRSSKHGNPAAKDYWKGIVAHKYDSWLLAQANAVKAWGGTFFLTWQHEPEHTYSWEGTPADYKAAWRYIISFFNGHGVTNARWVTSFLPTSFRGTNPKVNQFWPGDDLGLIAGSTGYNWACSAHTGTGPGCDKAWKSFSAVFSPVNAWATKKNVKWWVTETGTAEDPAVPGRKAQWLNDMQVQVDHWPLLTGVMWFIGSRSHDLFLPGTSQSSLDAFKFLMAEWAG